MGARISGAQLQMEANLIQGLEGEKNRPTPTARRSSTRGRGKLYGRCLTGQGILIGWFLTEMWVVLTGKW